MSSQPTSDTATANVITPQEPIAIIGIGCMFPKAQDLENYWANIRDGVDGITETPKTHWSTEDYYDADPDVPDKTYGRRGGFLDQTDFDPLEFGISPRDVEATDTAQLLGMAIAKQALVDAGYPADDPDLRRDRVSVVLGVTGTLELVIPLGARLGHPIWRRALKDAGVDPTIAEDVVERIRDSYVGWQENSFPGLLGNVVAGRIANRLDLHGTNCVVDAACASSLSAVHLAIMELQAGRADMVVTGGVDTFNNIFMYMCFSKTPALSPTGDARPFAANGDGTILGEGLGMLVLKRVSEAERDGDRIYAVIRGMGSSSDGKGNAVYAPSSQGQARALRNAYQNAGVDPSTIELVEAHGTGTKVGDATEIHALTSVYSGTARDGTWCALGSVKSMIGHTKAAAGAAGLIKAALALHHRVLPPTLKVSSPNDAAAPGSTPFYVNTQMRPWLPARQHPRRAGVSAFGFGGSNFHCVLEEYAPENTTPAIDWDGRVQILPIAAHDRDGLRVVLEDLRVALADTNDWSTVRGVAAKARHDFDPNLHCRLVLLLEADKTAPIAQFTAACDLLEQHGNADQWSSPLGIWFAVGPKTGEIAAVFPGQGSQYPGMLRHLLCQFPCAQEALANANAGGQATELSDHIFPHPAFDEATRQRQVDALRQTDVAQPAIGAVSLGAWNVLRTFGVQVAAATGHSYGELTALRAAGSLTEVDFHTLSWFRGKFMARGDGDRGRMLAVFAEHSVVAKFLERHNLDLVLANRNGPNQIVLSGASQVIEQAEQKLQEDGVRSKRLLVAAAFHSPLVAEATAPFGKLLTDIEFAKGSFPVYANTSAQPYPTRTTAARRLLAGQLAAPVEFQGCIENMRKAGITTFVEIGPGNTMATLISATLEGDPKVWTTSIDGSQGRSRADLARTLACLVAGGHHVDLELWDAGYLQRHNARLSARRPAFTVPISGANYVIHRDPKPPTPPAPGPARSEPAPTSPVQDVPATPRPPLPTPNDELIREALRTNQESLQALAKMQQQTAELHRTFLENQERATRSFEQLLTRQQSAFGIDQAGDPLPASHPLPVVKVEDGVPNLPVQALPGVSSGIDDATSVLLEVVAEKTGYPVEMLELSMGLDSDLGIDSIKRVEILSALQDKLPTAPAVKPEHLGELTTLGHIADFLTEGGTDSITTPAAAGLESSARPAGETGGIESILLGVVADKTGYPAEMLELSMGLDADLGIDSIKRVEILSALQEQIPDAPIVQPEHLGELTTLGEIVAFLSQTQIGTGNQAPVPASDQLEEVLLAIVADKTGYPAEMLDFSMDLDTDLGIDSIKRVEILSALQEQIPDAPVVKPEHLGELQTLRHILEFLAGASASLADPGSAPAKPVAPPSAKTGITRLVLARRQIETSKEVANDLPAQAVVWVTRSDDDLSQAIVDRLRQLGVKADEVERTTTSEPPLELSGMIVVADTASQPRFLHEAFAITRHVAARLRQSGERGAARYVTVSRLDGSFGLHDLCSEDVISGGLAGLAKTVSHEWPQVCARALDIDASETDPLWLGERIVAQFLADTDHLEIGISRQGACILETVPEDLPALATQDPTVLTGDDVVLITGGARGVTAEVAVSLAAAFGPRLVLIGRSPAPGPEPAWLRNLQDETSIKQAIFEQARVDDPKARLTPRDLTVRFAAITNNREILHNIDRMENAGSRVSYFSADVRDPDALATVLATVGRQLGPVTALVHGAGVLADSYISDKSDTDFARVVSTKVDGAQTLLAALRDADLKVIVQFASSTARYGRTGQADYAIANEVLNKLAQHEARRRPDCRVVSVNWGPWDGGMVTPTLRDIFADEGISVIDPRVGADYLAEELRNSGGPVEVVILGQGSVVPVHKVDESVLVPALSALPELPTVLERTLSIEDHPVLASHVLDGKAVLPLAVIIELLGHGALHRNPGLRLLGVRELRILKGVILSDGETCALRVCADQVQKRDRTFSVATELCSSDPAGARTLHARATIDLGTTREIAPVAEPAAVLPPYPLSIADAYKKQLFHGMLMQGLTSISGCSTDAGPDAGIIAHCHSAPAPGDWIRHPLRSRWITDPLAIDCAFQLMILWSFRANGAGSLPTSIGQYRQFVNTFPSKGVRIEVRVKTNDPGKAIADIDWLDHAGDLLARMTDYECVVDASLSSAFRRNSLESSTAVRK